MPVLPPFSAITGLSLYTTVRFCTNLKKYFEIFLGISLNLAFISARQGGVTIRGRGHPFAYLNIDSYLADIY